VILVVLVVFRNNRSPNLDFEIFSRKFWNLDRTSCDPKRALAGWIARKFWRGCLTPAFLLTKMVATKFPRLPEQATEEAEVGWLLGYSRQGVQR